MNSAVYSMLSIVLRAHKSFNFSLLPTPRDSSSIGNTPTQLYVARVNRYLEDEMGARGPDDRSEGERERALTGNIGLFK